MATINAVVSTKSISGESLFTTDAIPSTDNIHLFRSRPEDTLSAVERLKKLGFTVSAVSEVSISIQGEADLFQDVFGKPVEKRAVVEPGVEDLPDQLTPAPREFYDYDGDEPTTEALQSTDSDLAELIDGVALSIPPIYFEDALPPLAAVDPNAYPYLTVPDEVNVLLKASQVNRRGITGKGVVVAMLDTGFYTHPFFKVRGYRSLPTILTGGETNPDDDMYGHGTGEAANIFACAPDAVLLPIKNGDAVESFKQAVINGAQVITNSWGYHIDFPGTTWASLHPYYKALAQEIQLAIDKGVVVCFSAGNGHLAFPACMPDVIAVGGVHVNYPGITFEASSYASSFQSSIFPGREVPDFCGLTGNAVVINNDTYAPSLMLPVQPGCTLDAITPSTGSNTDGWGLFSGTSAACPQIAGICALLLQEDPWRYPADVKSLLAARALDVTAGTTGGGHTATIGPDLATGAGLAQAI